MMTLAAFIVKLVYTSSHTAPTPDPDSHTYRYSQCADGTWQEEIVR